MSERLTILAVALVAVALAVGPRWLLDPRIPPPVAGGIQLNEPDLDLYSEALADAGLDSVQITTYAVQPLWNGPDLVWPDRDPKEVVYQVEKAHEGGLSAVLVLRLAIDHGRAENRHLWHGMIWPEDLDTWFDNYRAYALWGARIAQEHGVEVLVLANELNSMTSTLVPDEGELSPYDYFSDPERTAKVRADLVACADHVRDAELSLADGEDFTDFDAILRDEEEARRRWSDRVTGGGDQDARRAVLRARGAELDRRWRLLIEDVRRVYRGPISIGANFDSYDRVGFWDAVDALGVTSYFPLRRWGDDSPEALRNGWRAVADALEAAALHDEVSTPIYLLELGYTRKSGSTVRPWSYSRVEVLETVGEVEPGAAPPHTCAHWASWPEDPFERARAVGALADVVEAGDFPSLRGFSLWKLTTRTYHLRHEQFAVLVPAEHRDSTPNAADSELLEHAARLGRAIRASRR